MTDPFYTIEQYGEPYNTTVNSLLLSRLHQLAVAERDAWQGAQAPSEYRTRSRGYWRGYVAAIERVMALVDEQPPWTVTVKKGGNDVV
jgi:hypothetical protein